MKKAAKLGQELRREDFEHDELDEGEDDLFLTDKQIARMLEKEKEVRARLEEQYKKNPPKKTKKKQPQREPSPPPIPVSQMTGVAIPNVIVDDDAIQSGVSDALKAQLIAYAPVERLYSLVMSWLLSKKQFDAPGTLSGQLVRYGCTCIAFPTDPEGGICRYSMDTHYEKKKEDAENARRKRKEMRTAKGVAKRAARMSKLAKLADMHAPATLGDEEDDDPRRHALRIAMGGMDLSSQSSADFVEPDEVPAFADDHVQLVVKLSKPRDQEYFVVASVHCEVGDVEY